MFQALREMALKRPLSFADLFSVRVLQAPPLRQIRQNEQEIGEIAGCNWTPIFFSNFFPLFWAIFFQFWSSGTASKQAS